MGNNILIYVEASWSLSTVDVFHNICSGREGNFRDRFVLLLRDTVRNLRSTQNCVGGFWIL